MSDDRPKLRVAVVGTGSANARTLAAIAGETARPVEVKHAWRHVPVVTGAFGKAWLCDEAVGLKRLNIEPRRTANVCHWVVYAPYAHPCWHSYSVLCIHLRPIEGMSPPKLYLPCASHELLVHALSVDNDLNLLIEDGIVRGDFLQPINFGAQFTEADDDAARGRIRRTVEEICAGQLNPDTDYQQQWVDRFGNNMIKRAFR